MPTDQERLASLEAHKENTEKAIAAIFEYTKEGRVWREATTSTLATLVVNQVQMKEYQDTCNTERSDIKGRISKIELGESRQAGKASIINAIIAAVVSAIVTLAASFGNLFETGGKNDKRLSTSFPYDNSSELNGDLRRPIHE